MTTLALAACSMPAALDPFCEDKAKKSLRQLADSALPYLDKAKISSVVQTEQCDSGGTPYVEVSFRPGVSVDAAVKGLTGSPWTKLDHQSAAAYEESPETLIFTRKLGTDGLVLMADPETGNQVTLLTVEFNFLQPGG